MHRTTSYNSLVADLVMHTTNYHELAEDDLAFAQDYWKSTQRMYGKLGYEPAEFTAMSWLVDETLKRFNTQVEELIYDGQEA